MSKHMSLLLLLVKLPEKVDILPAQTIFDEKTMRAPQSLGSSLLRVLLLGMMIVYAKASTIYAEKGKSVTLKPTTKTSEITSIMWKLGPDLAADWDKQTDGSVEICYSQFEGRCQVNFSTGALTIEGLTSEDAGDFSADINYVDAGKFDLKIISSVAKPSINESCDAQLTNCLLTCEGETPDAKPITYGWPGVDGHSDRVLRITKDMKIETFSCVIENPISNRSSESIPNPFKSPTTADLTPLWITVGVVVLVALGFTAYYIYKRKCVQGSDSYSMVPTNGQSNQDAGGIEFKQLSAGNHTHSNGDVPGEGANHSPSPVSSQNGLQRAEDRVEVERPDQILPAPAPQDSTEYDEISAEVERPDQILPAPAPQDSTEHDEVKVEVGRPDQSIPAPALQDSTEHDETLH